MPDLIILDIGLPGRDGYSVMQSLHVTELADVPVIVLTARDAFTHQRRCRDAGAKRFFEKPVTNLRLMTAIQQLLG
jgi:CheY-like chemotaxis protein